MPPKKTSKHSRSKKTSPSAAKSETPAKPQAAAKTPRKRRWYHVVIPFMLFLFVFGGTDAFLLRDVGAFASALFFVLVLQWDLFLKLPFPITRLRKSLVSGLLLLGYFAVVLFLIPPVRIARDTTYLTEPKTADGQRIDYEKGIEQKVDPDNLPEENGLRLLAEALGPGILQPAFETPSEDRGNYWDALCEKLRLDPNVRPQLVFQSAASFLKSRKEGEESPKKTALRLGEKPWTKEEFPVAADWIAANSPIFDLFAEAVAKPEFRIPMLKIRDFQPLDSREIPSLSTTEIFRNLRLRLLFELGEGEPEKAWADLRTQFRYARHLTRTATREMDAIHAGWWVEEAVQSGLLLLQYGNFSNEELQKRFKELREFWEPPGEKTSRNIFFAERLILLDRFQSYAFGRNLGSESPGSFVFHGPNRFARFFYWNRILVRINDYFDWLEAQGGAKDAFFGSMPIRGNTSPWSEIIQYGIFKAVPEKVGRNAILSWNDQNRSFEKSGKDARTKTAMLETAFYLAMYRNAHEGTFPEKLEDLPQKTPEDPFNVERPLLYKRSETGDGYTLYSVGPNGVDDDGLNRRERPEADDIGIRMP